MKVRLRRRRYRCSPGGAILPGLHLYLRRSLRSLEKMGLLTTITRSSTRGRRSNLYLLHIGTRPDLSMRSARTVNLGEDAAQACQMLEEASSAVFVANKAIGHR